MCNYYLPFCKFRKRPKQEYLKWKRCDLAKNISKYPRWQKPYTLLVGSVITPLVWRPPSLIPSQRVNTSSPLSVMYKPQTRVQHANKNILYILRYSDWPPISRSQTCLKLNDVKMFSNSITLQIYNHEKSFSKTKNAAFHDIIQLKILNSHYKVLSQSFIYFLAGGSQL